MQRDFDPLELLALWWKAEHAWLPVEGYPTECPSCRDYRTSRQYDSHNGADETDARGMLIRHVNQAVQQVPEPFRTALYVLARNQATGVTVWRSARLPADDQARAQMVAEALEMFLEGV